MTENVKLTAEQQYAWTAVIVEGPLKRGASPGKSCNGVFMFVSTCLGSSARSSFGSDSRSTAGPVVG